MNMQIDSGHTIEFKPIHEANTTAGTPQNTGTQGAGTGDFDSHRVNIAFSPGAKVGLTPTPGNIKLGGYQMYLNLS